MATKGAEGPRRARPAADKGPRHHARALVLQGLYGWLLAGGGAADIARQLLDAERRAKVDVAFFESMLGACIDGAEGLRAEFTPSIDRPVAELSPVEHAVLLLGTCELKHHPEIPYRVVINEAVELAKSFGGTEGYRYVNGVLDRVGARLRPTEARAPLA